MTRFRRAAPLLIALVIAAMLGILNGLGEPVTAQSSRLGASFDVTFKANFVQSALGSGQTLPDDTSFGSVAIAVHGDAVSFLTAGDSASAGLKEFAETGATNRLVREFRDSPHTASAFAAGSSSTGATFPQTAEAEQTFADLRATRARSQLTFLASFSQSPDWFVGAGDVELRSGGEWIQEQTVDLFAWDAGTDDGLDFDSADSPTSPPGNIASLKGAGKFSETAIGQLTITLGVPLSDDRSQRIEKADAGSLDGALNVFWWTLTDNTLDGVDYDRYLVAWKSGAEEFQTDPQGDRVKVVMGRQSDQVILEGLDNGTELDFLVAGGTNIGMIPVPFIGGNPR